MTTQEPKPRGRRPGKSDTKEVILATALRLFSEVGYEKVSLRAVARAADVDAALIHHYFENKADLFAKAVLDLPLDADAMVAKILDGPLDSIGERSVAVFLESWEPAAAHSRFVAMLRAAITETGGHRPLSEFLSREVFGKVTEALGHEDAALRAQIVVSLLLGLTIGRNILKLPALTRTRDAQLIQRAGRALQTQLV